MDELKERLIRHYLLLSILILLTGVILFFNRANRDFITFVTDATGYMSLIAIAVAMITGTLQLIGRRRNSLNSYFRRDLGITAGILAITHSITGLFVHLRGNNWQYFLTRSDHGYSIRMDNFGLANYFGLISALIILVLTITSNNYSMRRLGPYSWKNLQRFTYVMFILAVIHSIYYRIVANNERLIFTFYIPLFLFVFIFQMTGVFIKVREIET